MKVKFMVGEKFADGEVIDQIDHPAFPQMLKGMFDVAYQEILAQFEQDTKVNKLKDE